ncbi:type II toxin-antitoxin system RelE/ParE family toxin [Pseudomonas gingeri]|uniref:Type II toxin-antitoxin system RelE/ParE family toxin n=1 Tax=Pseudomonas gingeri TaxID=117681 RepID=A0A7Y8BUN0_9PSED|nr:type II toxin-antitoxin system RelE/ParE family toxin [Pseudomonas gingeri]NWB88623.1 type II toxin-antitoxin system RelE/ParE family toxin [Pseudomonas gingeri]
MKNSLGVIFLGWHTLSANWEIEYTDEFECWWDRLTESEQDSVEVTVMLLGDLGPHLGFPHSSHIKGSRYGHLRELRIQHGGRPYRVMYVFDPRRCAILLLGGDKTGQDRWYEENIPKAERLYDEHLDTLRKEGFDNG